MASVLREKFRLTFEEAWPLFRRWNETCQLALIDREFAHKLEDFGKQT